MMIVNLKPNLYQHTDESPTGCGAVMQRTNLKRQDIFALHQLPEGMTKGLKGADSPGSVTTSPCDPSELSSSSDSDLPSLHEAKKGSASGSPVSTEMEPGDSSELSNSSDSDLPSLHQAKKVSDAGSAVSTETEPGDSSEDEPVRLSEDSVHSSSDLDGLDQVLLEKLLYGTIQRAHRVLEQGNERIDASLAKALQEYIVTAGAMQHGAAKKEHLLAMIDFVEPLLTSIPIQTELEKSPASTLETGESKRSSTSIPLTKEVENNLSSIPITQETEKNPTSILITQEVETSPTSIPIMKQVKKSPFSVPTTNGVEKSPAPTPTSKEAARWLLNVDSSTTATRTTKEAKKWLMNADIPMTLDAISTNTPRSSVRSGYSSSGSNPCTPEIKQQSPRLVKVLEQQTPRFVNLPVDHSEYFHSDSNTSTPAHPIRLFHAAPKEESDLLVHGSAGDGSEVFLHVYEVGMLAPTVHKVLATLGTGAYHVGVEVYGREFSYGNSTQVGRTGVGIQQTPRKHPSHRYFGSLSLGRTELSPGQLKQLIEELKALWPAENYHALRNNCVSFAEVFCARLGVSQPPEHVGALAKGLKDFFLTP